MPPTKFDPQRFFATPTAVAALAAADEVFGLLSRRIDLPAGVAALVSRRQGDHRVTAAGGTLDAEDASEVLFVRTTPIDLRWEEQQLSSEDHFQARASIDLYVQVVAEPSELLSFRKEILGSDARADVETLIRYLKPPVREGLSGAAARCKVGNLIDGRSRDALTAAVNQAIAGPCFEAGLVADPTPSIELESPTFRQVRQSEEDAERKRREQAAQRQLQKALETAQHAHLAHLEGMLDRLRKLAEQSPDLGLPELMRTFTESQRGEIYEALFAAGEEAATRWIIVAAGGELLFYDPANTEAAVRRLPLDDGLGGLRSVQTVRDGAGGTRLLVGAARGVYEVDPESDAPAVAYRFGENVEVRGGVNAAALAGDRVVATHSEVGLSSWPRGQQADAELLLESFTRDASAVRAVQFLDGRVYFSADEKIIVFPADSPTDENAVAYTGCDATITAVLPTPDSVYAGNAQGQVVRWPLDQPSAVQIVHSGGLRPTESLHLLQISGIARLFFTDTSLAVHARVLGDSFACRYEAGGQTLRRVEVAPDLIVGTNELRDRLLLWKPDKPAGPSGTISIARQTGHSIQDVCLMAQA